MPFTLTARFRLHSVSFLKLPTYNPNQIHIINRVLAAPVTDVGIVTAPFIGKHFGSFKQAFQPWDYTAYGLK